jgi:hypothetical protein
MDISSIGQLPKELTYASWNKAKGLLGKTKPTGLGDELKKLEALHKKIDQQKLDPASSPVRTREEITKRTQDAMAHYKATVAPMQKHLHAVSKVADAAEKTLKKVPGKASKAAAAISKSASVFAVTCKSLDMKSRVAKLEGDMDRKDEIARKQLEPSIKKFLVGLKAYVGSEQTKQNWSDMIKQNGRSISNYVAQLPVYRSKFWKDFEKFKGFDEVALKITGDEEADKKRRLAILKMVQAQVAAIAKYKPK